MGEAGASRAAGVAKLSRAIVRTRGGWPAQGELVLGLLLDTATVAGLEAADAVAINVEERAQAGRRRREGG